MNLEVLRQDIMSVTESILGHPAKVVKMTRLNRALEDGPALLVGETLFVYPTPVTHASGAHEELAIDRLWNSPADFADFEPIGGPNQTFRSIPEATSPPSWLNWPASRPSGRLRSRRWPGIMKEWKPGLSPAGARVVDS